MHAEARKEAERMDEEQRNSVEVYLETRDTASDDP